MDPATALVGGAVGIVVGLTSMGGGALLTPALVLVAGVPPSLAIGSDVLVAACMKLFGSGAYALRREVHWGTVGRLALGSVPAALLGVAVLNVLPKSLLDLYLGRALGVTLLLAGAATVLRLRLPAPATDTAPPRAAVTVLLGAATGFLVATTSVGSGSLLMCVLALFFPFRSQQLVGTDLAHAFLLSSAATLGHLFSGRVDLGLAGGVLIGAIPGVIVGARLALALPEKVLRIGLAALLVSIGTYLSLFNLHSELP